MPVMLRDRGRLILTHEVQNEYYWATGSDGKRVKVPFKQIKISIDVRGCNGVVMVALDGWNRSDWEKVRPDERKQFAQDTTGMQIRFSMNAPMQLTWYEWQEINRYIENLYYRLMDDALPVPEGLL